MAKQKDEKFDALFSKGLKDIPAPPPPVPAPQYKTPGRPPTGKRSNPDYRQWCGFLKIATTEDAEDILRVQNRKSKREGGVTRDMSDLVQELLEGWVLRERS